MIDSLIKNYENNRDLQRVIDRMILEGYEFPFTRTDAVVDLGVTFGIFSNKDGTLQISNKIFEIILYNHIIMKKLRTEEVDIPIRFQFLLVLAEQILYVSYHSPPQKDFFDNTKTDFRVQRYLLHKIFIGVCSFLYL